MMLSPPVSPVTANVNDASHFAGGNRVNTPRPPSIASVASQATSGLHNGSQSSHNTYDDYGTTPMSGSLPPSPSPTNAFDEPPTDEGEASAEEMPEDEGIPSGGEPQPVAAHIQVKQAYRVLTNEALGMYHDQGDHDFVMVASGLVAKHPPIRQAFAKVEVEPGTPPPHLRDGVIFAANEPPAKFAIDLERALSEGDARALVGRSVRACLKTYAAIAPKNKEIKIGVQDALEALEMLITTEGTKAFMASGGRGDNPVCAVLWQVALTLMGVITQLGYTYVTSLSKPANETRPTPAMPALTHRSARGAIGILYFHRLFGFAVEDLVERIVAYEDGEGLILTRPIMPIA